MTSDKIITPVKTNLTDPPRRIIDFEERIKAFFRSFKRDRRKNKRDRRRSVRNGVIVKLSTIPDRRKGPDRRALKSRF